MNGVNVSIKTYNRNYIHMDVDQEQLMNPNYDYYWTRPQISIFGNQMLIHLRSTFGRVMLKTGQAKNVHLSSCK